MVFKREVSKPKELVKQLSKQFDPNTLVIMLEHSERYKGRHKYERALQECEKAAEYCLTHLKKEQRDIVAIAGLYDVIGRKKSLLWQMQFDKNNDAEIKYLNQTQASLFSGMMALVPSDPSFLPVFPYFSSILAFHKNFDRYIEWTDAGIRFAQRMEQDADALVYLLYVHAERGYVLIQQHRGITIEAEKAFVSAFEKIAPQLHGKSEYVRSLCIAYALGVKGYRISGLIKKAGTLAIDAIERFLKSDDDRYQVNCLASLLSAAILCGRDLRRRGTADIELETRTNAATIELSQSKLLKARYRVPLRMIVFAGRNELRSGEEEKRE